MYFKDSHNLASKLKIPLSGFSVNILAWSVRGREVKYVTLSFKPTQNYGTTHCVCLSPEMFCLTAKGS
jgi:hypothetical protein